MSRQAIVGIIIGCMCLCGVIVTTIYLVVLMRKPPNETAANNYVDYGPDTNAGAFNNPLYNEVGIKAAFAAI